MSGYIGDVSNYYGAANTSLTSIAASKAYKSDNMDAYGLDMSDFLNLMVAQFTNQGMDNTADINDMLNQLVQMQMVTALASMSTTMETMTDHSIMTYAASLVGKEVTVAGNDADGNYAEFVGTVTATGSYGGEQVIFVDDKMFYMTQIIAVGRLPSVETGSTGGSDSTKPPATDEESTVPPVTGDETGSADVPPATDDTATGEDAGSGEGN